MYEHKEKSYEYGRQINLEEVCELFTFDFLTVITEFGVRRVLFSHLPIPNFPNCQEVKKMRTPQLSLNTS